MSTEQKVAMGKDRTGIGQIKADQIPDTQEEFVSCAQSAQSAFYFAAEYAVRLDLLAFLYTDLSFFFAAVATPSSRAAAAIWATMEIAANIIEHGHRHPDPDAVFHVVATIHADRVEIVLRDRGVVFDCAQLSHSALPSHWQAHKRGGLGLSLARRAVDELSYAREDGVNVWKIGVRSAWCVCQ